MRGKSSKKFFVTLLLVMVMVFAVACGGGQKASEVKTTEPTAKPTDAPAAKPVKLKAVMITTWLKTGMEEVLKSSAAEAGIDLEIDRVPDGEQGNTVIKTRFATKELPDLLFYYSNSAPIKELGNPSELFVEQTNQPWMKNYDQNVWKGATDIDGVFYGAPYGGANAGVMLYNKKVFGSLGIEIPKSWDELLAAAEKIKQAGKTPVYVSGKDGWTTMLMAFYSGSVGVVDFGAKLDTNQLKFVNEDNLKIGLEKSLELKTKGLINKDYLSDTYDNAQKAIATGEAGMYPMASWVMDDIAKKFPDNVNDIGSFIVPVLGNGKDIAPTWAPFSVYVLKGKNQEAAQKFVNYFESIETQNKFFSAEGGIPAIKGVTKTKLTPAALDAKKFVDEGKTGPVWGSFKYGYGDFGALTQDMMAGGKTPTQVLESADKEFQKNAKAKGDPKF